MAGATAAIGGQGPGFADDRPRLPALPPVVAWTLRDLDGDGLQDLVWAGAGELGVLLQNRGGRFLPHPLQPPVNLPATVTVVGVECGQLTPDVFPDVVVVLQGGPAQLAVNDGTGVLQLVQPTPFARIPTSPATAALVADLDRRGLDDLLVLTDGGKPQLWLSNATGGFGEVSATALPPVALPAARGAFGDVDLDGDLDLVLASALGAVPQLLTNDGAGGFTLEAGAITVPALAVGSLALAPLDPDPWPDLLFGTLAAAPQNAVVLRNTTQRRFAPLPQTGSDLQLAGVLGLWAGRIDGDAFADAAFLQASGELRIGLNNGAGVFRAGAAPLPAGGRALLLGGDLENDGDADLLVAGRGAAPEVLLGNGRGSFLATESVTVPALAADRALSWSMAEAGAGGELDLVAYDAQGAGRIFANDGSGCFALRGPAPALPAATYGALTPAAITRPGARDLVVLGQPVAVNPTGLRILVGSATGLKDETVLRLPASLPGVPAQLAAGDLIADGPTSNGFADLVVADARGGLVLLVNRSGVLAPSPNAFGTQTVASPTGIALARLNADALLDVVVFSGAGAPRVFVQAAAGGIFLEVPNAVPLAAANDAGDAGDLTGDGIADLVLVASGPPRTMLFAGLGDGRFTDQSVQLPALPAAATLQLLGPEPALGRGPALVLGGVNGLHSQLLVRAGNLFQPPVPLGLRAAAPASRCLSADLDADGDADLLVQHESGAPEVLFGQRTQLTHLGGATQIGRALELRLHAPKSTAGAAAALFFSAAPARLPLAPFGILRLAAPIQLVTFPIPPNQSAVDLSFPIGRLFPPGSLPMQCFVLHPATLTGSLTSLELVEFASF